MKKLNNFQDNGLIMLKLGGGFSRFEFKFIKKFMHDVIMMSK